MRGLGRHPIKVARANPGPTANLKARHRRSGRSGTVWEDGKMQGEVHAIEWGVEIEQIAVSIPGTWQDEFKPGAEARRGTLRLQDLHDKWSRRVYLFLKARREGNRELAAEFPTFELVTKVDDIGAPARTTWAIRDCELFSYAGGYSQDDNLLMRDVPFTFRDDEPLESFEYTDGGVRTYP